MESVTASVAEVVDTDQSAVEDAEEGSVEDELVLTATLTVTATGPRYTADLSDAELARLWAEDRRSLGTVAIGLPAAGRLVNAEPFPPGPHWFVVDPPNTWATRETIDFVITALEDVYRQYPDTPPLRVNHISGRAGGYLPPHWSHQAGRDVDLAFFYLPGAPLRGYRERYFDPVRNWALLRAIVTLTDVQVVLADHRIQKILYDYALSIGEDETWLDGLFYAGTDSIVQHARGHRDHFHIRFFNPRAQELGRRLQPILGPSEEVAPLLRYRIRNGDNLGRIAQRYRVSIRALMRTNRMRSSFLRAGRTLVVPVRGGCVRCPTAPEIIVPPRRLPGASLASEADEFKAGATD